MCRGDCADQNAHKEDKTLAGGLLGRRMPTGLVDRCREVEAIYPVISCVRLRKRINPPVSPSRAIGDLRLLLELWNSAGPESLERPENLETDNRHQP